MTSPYVRPDLAAFAELSRLVGHLTEELAAWRRRCQRAETALQALKTPGGMVSGDDVTKARGRTLDLERENIELRARLDRARDMVLELKQRLAFVDDTPPATGAPR